MSVSTSIDRARPAAVLTSEGVLAEVRREHLAVKKTVTFLIAAGGTGGHVIPGLQVARELQRRGHQVRFVGTPKGLENRLVPQAGFPLEILPIGALNQVPRKQQIQTLLALPAAFFRASSLLDRTRPGAVLSLGGYASGPLMLMATMREISVVILEPNAKPGLANRLVAPFATRALVGFPQAARYFPAGRVEVSGIPIRDEFFHLPRRIHERPFRVLITGGSQGSHRLNQAGIESLPLWAARGCLGELHFTHQTGPKEYNGVQSAYALHRATAHVTPFLDDMPRAFAEADLVVCRAGASTVAELSAAGKASVLIPFPFAADQHQLHNAESMAAAGAARVVLDAEWNGERFVEEVDRFLEAPSLLLGMESAARRMARPGAAQRVADCLEEQAQRVQSRGERKLTNNHGKEL